MKSKCERGEYVFGETPIGYEKSQTEKNVVVVNAKEAKIVRYIFSLAIEGFSSGQIAKKLFEEGLRQQSISFTRTNEALYFDKE